MNVFRQEYDVISIEINNKLIMSKLSLKYLQAFYNAAYSASSSLTVELSPSNNLLALLDRSSVLIFNTSTKALMTSLALNATSVLFDVNDAFIYISDGFSLQKVNFGKSGGSEMIIGHDENNEIGSVVYSADHKRIYFFNHSALGYYSPQLSAINATAYSNPTLCPLDAIFVDPLSQTLISSSYDCKLCSFSLSTREPTLQASNSLSQCRVNSIQFANNYGMLTQDSITTKQPQIILLNLRNLNVISYINQSSTNLSLNLLTLRNYIASYAREDDHIWIYKDFITNKPNKVVLSQKIISMAYNEIANEAYVVALNDSSQSISISSYSLAFNCSLIQNTVGSSGSFEEKCQCKTGMLFDAANQVCKAMDCSNNDASPCQCPYQSSFESFSLSCSINCSSIYNTFSSISFGNPSQCSCNHPFEWNPSLSDCSYIDCSLVNNTVPSALSQKCMCESSYTWQDEDMHCRRNDSSVIISEATSSSSPVGLIIGIIFIVLVVILSAVIYYVKKYRKSPQDLPKTYQFPRKYEEHSPTPRPLAFENLFKTSEELKQPSPEEVEHNQHPSLNRSHQ